MTNKLLGSHDLDGLYAGNVLELGYPRVDTTLSAIREDVRKKLTIDSEKPILLFAPTWRGEVGNVSGVNVRLVENLEHLCKALKDKYDIVYRGHVLEQKQIAQMRLPCRIVPDNIDTNELLAAVDYLITDYSSIFFDYLVQKKPVSLFVYDEEFYLKERGMYFGLEEIPAYKCKTISDLIDRVKHGDWSKDFSTTYETFRAKYLYLDDGRATQRTIDAIWHGSEEYVRKIDSQDKLNLVFYCGGFGSNGITSSALNLFSKFDYEKHNVILCESEYLDPEREYNLRRLNHNIKVFYRVGQSNTLPAEKKTLKDYYKTGRLGLKREQILRQHFGRERKRLLGDTRVDVTVDFCGYVKFWALLLSMNDISRKVIYQHNDMMAENDKMINGKYKHRNNFKVIFDSYRWFDRIVSVSKNTRDLNYSFFRSFVSRPDERFVHVTNAIDAKSIVEKSLLSNEVELKGQLYLYDESERAHDGKTLTLYTAPRRDFTNFIHIGRFSPEKRHDKLLTAFREVRAQKLNTMLYLLGSGPLYESTKRLASSLGVADSVVFLGQVKNPYALIAKCDCFVLASDHEGQPMVLLESLVLGKPVLATDIVGSRSVLENTGGKLVPNSVEGLVEGMMEFIDGKIPAPRFDHEKYQMETMALFYKEVCGRQ
jgi:CDP-glycerol glycerophosphotransferase